MSQYDIDTKESTMIRINLILDGEVERKFQRIKDKLGLKGNPEVFRYLVNQAYEELEKKGLYSATPREAPGSGQQTPGQNQTSSD